MRFLLVMAALALGGCGTLDPVGEPGGDGAVYPEGPYDIALGATLPDLSFDGVGADGAPAEVALHDYLAPASDDLLLLVVSGGLWCGTCRWPAEEAALLSGPRIHRLDLVLADRDNAPADAGAAAAWQSEFDLAVAVGADPDFRMGALLAEPAPLPLFVMVDAATMRVLDTAASPTPAELRERIDALLDEGAPPAADPLVDGLFQENEWALLQLTVVPGAPPPDPTNAVADDPAAAALGRALFFDAGLSPSGTISCASCHRPDAALADTFPRARGVDEGDRRTPSIALAAHARWQFWDGRADTLWAQALGPLENPLEFDSSRLFVARRILDAHPEAYRAAFPGAPLPEASWPAAGKPGDLAYDALSAADRDAATLVFVNAGKAIAAWERTLRVERNPLDDYLSGDLDAIDAEEKYGLHLFVKRGCMQCHWGPRLTDDAFHDLRLPTGRRDAAPDPGRSAGLLAWQASPFRADGPYSDAPAVSAPATDPDALRGQFKTPPLRGVADRAFLGHGGTFVDLADITESYGTGAVPEADPSSAGPREPWLPHFGETAQWGLVPFLELLTARPILR